MNLQHIIKEALIEYDTVRPIIRYLQKNTHGKVERPESDMVRTKITFYDNDTNEILLFTEVETLAIFYDKFHIWNWAWSQPGLTNAENYLSKEILKYALTLGSDLTYFKSILTTSRGTINDLTQIDINLAISSNIIKQPYILPYVYKIEEYHLIYYLILLNKEDLDKLKSRMIGITTSEEE